MDPQEWFNNMPSVTKFLFSSALMVTLAGNFGLVNPMSLILNFPAVWQGFEVWRLFTGGAFFGKLGFPFLINVYFLYNYSNNLETGLFDGRKADYVFMLLVQWVFMLLVSWVMNLPIFGVPMVLAIVYVWCNANADVIVSFWFGTKFKAMYFPWVLAAFNVLLGGSGMMELLGILVGHAYFFLKYEYPRHNGSEILTTPQWLKNMIPDRQGGMGTFGGNYDNRPPPAARPRTWGTGQRLGGDGN